jgi:hypothetical protein
MKKARTVPPSVASEEPVALSHVPDPNDEERLLTVVHCKFIWNNPAGVWSTERKQDPK